MSLFKLCTWWTAQCPDVAPTYDSYLLHCCRFGLSDTEKDYVVVGSHSGYLSIFQPGPARTHPVESSDEFDIALASSSGRPTDLLLEQKLSHPIIGIATGRFVSATATGHVQLAILHPMKISVYAVLVTAGLAEHGNQTKLNLCFEHKFQRFAFSFCHGGFGGVKGKDFLCVVHVNSSLSLYEQEGITYECVLPGGGGEAIGVGGDRNIPSVLRYVTRVDSFVTVSAACELECYRYQDLGQSIEGGRQMEPAWTCSVGEFALDIWVNQISNDESAIMILGENNLISISDTGKLRFIKRLDYTPVCFHSFVIGWFWEQKCRLITAVASDRGSVLVYEESRLIWSLQLSGDQLPVAIQRSNVTGLPGALVTLGETGLLQIGYFGSEPHPFKVPVLNLQQLNYESAQHELAELEKEIGDGVDFTEFSMAAAAANRDLHVEMVVAAVSKLERCKFPTNLGADIDAADQRQCLVTVSLRAAIRIEQIQVYLDVAPPLRCSKPLHMFRDVLVGRSDRLDAWVYVNDVGPVPSIAVRAVVSFINTQSICRVIEKKLTLPLAMFFKHTQPQKDGGAAVKLTFSAESANPPNLAALLLPDFVGDTSQAIGLRSLHAPDAVITIVTAKKSNRVRIQANEVHALAVVVDVLLERIKANDPGVRIIMVPQLPGDEIADAIGKHHQRRLEYLADLKSLEDRSAQMRLVQRRFFVKVESKKPEALDSITMLFKRTHAQIVDILKAMEKSKATLTRSQLELSCVLALAQAIVRHLDLPSRSKDSLSALLVTPAIDWLEQGYEDVLNPPLEKLNHMGPLKKSKNTALDESPSYATLSLDIVRFKRHFVGLLERACRLANSSSAPNERDDSIELDEETLEEEDVHEPQQSDWTNNSDQPMTGF